MATTKVHAKAQKQPVPVGGEKRPKVPEKRAGPETMVPTRATSFRSPATGDESSTVRAARILRIPEGSPGAAHRARLATAMQGPMGNARVGRMLAARAGGGASPRLDVVHPEDRSEKEAEAVAGRVSAGRPAPPIGPLAEAGTRTLSRAESEEPLPAGAEPPVARAEVSSALPPPNGEPSAARAAKVLRSPSTGPGAGGRARMATAMQGAVGNARLGRMLAARSATAGASGLDVVHPEDRSEKEAEVVAARVSAGRPAPPIAPLAASGARTLSRIEADEPLAIGAEPKGEDKPLQRAVDFSGPFGSEGAGDISFAAPSEKIELPWMLADAALKNSDPALARKIKQFNQVMPVNRLKIIQLFIQKGVKSDSSYIEQIWASFGVNLFAVASAIPSLWKASIEFGAKLGGLEATKDLAKQFKEDVKSVADKQLSHNEDVIQDELGKLGIYLGFSPSGKSTDHTYWMEEPTEQQKINLEKTRHAAAEVAALQASMAELRKAQVGWERYYEQTCEVLDPVFAPQMAQCKPPDTSIVRTKDGAYSPVSFSPEKPPSLDLETLPESSRQESRASAPWADVKDQWNSATTRIERIGKESPLIFVLLQDQQAEQVVEASSARKTIASAAMKVLDCIAETRSDLEGDDLDYMMLTPIHQKLFSGQARGQIDWSQPVQNLIAQQLIEEHRRSEAVTEVLLGMIGAVLTIVTLGKGGLVLAVVLALDAAIAVGITAKKWEEYLDLAQANKAAVGEEERIVSEADVELKKESAVLDSILTFLVVAGAAADALSTIRRLKLAKEGIEESLDIARPSVASGVDEPPVQATRLASLSERHQDLLKRLADADEFGVGLTQVAKREVTATDLAVLTRHTSHEHALVILHDNRRVLVDLGSYKGGTLPPNTRTLLMHSHPYDYETGMARLISQEDVDALLFLNQRYSYMVTVDGTVYRFTMKTLPNTVGEVVRQFHPVLGWVSP